MAQQVALSQVTADPAQVLQLLRGFDAFGDGLHLVTGRHFHHRGDDLLAARIIGGADVYMSDFGELEIVPHYLMSGSTNVFGFNPDYADIVYLDGFKSEPLAKTGDSEKEQVLVDCCLRLTAENVHFKVANLTA